MSVPCVPPLLGTPVQCQPPHHGVQGTDLEVTKPSSRWSWGGNIPAGLWDMGCGLAEERGHMGDNEQGGHRWIHTLLPLHRGLVSHCIAILKVSQGLALVMVVTLVVLVALVAVAALVVLLELVAMVAALVPVALVTLVSIGEQHFL